MSVSICKSCGYVHDHFTRICEKCDGPTDKANAPNHTKVQNNK